MVDGNFSLISVLLCFVKQATHHVEEVQNTGDEFNGLTEDTCIVTKIKQL